MLYGNIKTGDRLEISLLASQDSTSQTFVSQVEDIVDPRNIVIHAPISYGRIIKLKKNIKYSMLFFTDAGSIKFVTEAVDFKKEGDFDLIQVNLLSEGERVQRRDYYRFNCLLPMKFSVLEEVKIPGTPAVKAEKGTGEQFNDAIIKDLSGGGIRFISNKETTENSIIKCFFMLEKESLLLIGKILRRTHFPKSAYKYQYSVQFVGIVASEREKIIRYIFNEQRKTIIKTKNN